MTPTELRSLIHHWTRIADLCARHGETSGTTPARAIVRAAEAELAAQEVAMPNMDRTARQA